MTGCRCEQVAEAQDVSKDVKVEFSLPQRITGVETVIYITAVTSYLLRM